MSLVVFLTAMAVITIASALQAATGMGMALIAAPLLALLDTHLVPVPMLIAVMLLSALVSWRSRNEIDGTILPASLSGLLVGCACGAALLVALQGVRLDRVFAVLILGAVGLSLTGFRLPMSRVTLLIGGGAAGIFGTMSGAHGPPIALVLQHEPPERMRATLCAFFTIGCALSLFMLGLGGLFDWAGLQAGIELLPGVAIGLLIAPLLGRWIDRRRARWAVLSMSTCSALVLLFR